MIFGTLILFNIYLSSNNNRCSLIKLYIFDLLPYSGTTVQVCTCLFAKKSGLSRDDLYFLEKVLFIGPAPWHFTQFSLLVTYRYGNLKP